MGGNGTAGTGRPLVLRAAGRAGRVVAGAAGLALRAATDVPTRLGGHHRTPDGWDAPPAPPAPGGHDETAAVVRLAAARLGEAALGLAAVTSRRALDVAAAAALPVEAAATIAVRAGTAVAGRSRLAGRIDRLARVGRVEQRRNEREAALLLRSAWQRSVARAVAATDVDAVLDRIDLDAVVAKVDLDALVAQVDLDAVVARLDVDAVVGRVDLDALIARLDIPVLVEQVLDDVDLGRIVRESSTGMAAETVDAVRSRSAGADRAINGFVDRVVLRRPPRDGSVPAPSEPGRAPP
ncbi:hypothetical protein E1212_20885 [Jiangella ureilytica]|uniref:Uncharacterized protein n=1 Tax=Jiangella ureilytica TaxID=2530374 RepID=A0A4R4RJC4_9ACTN|nr:hypothetical protein [Jiangella ureilytica]TDC48563.1 hypothetical protein E1212_20885 [Jiangella ureilytica]